MESAYDKTNPLSIEEYAKRLIGMSFSDVCNADQNNEVIVIDDEYETSHEDKKRKGGLGDLIEERFFITSVIVILDLTFLMLVLN